MLNFGEEIQDRVCVDVCVCVCVCVCVSACMSTGNGSVAVMSRLFVQCYINAYVVYQNYSHV